MIYWPALLQLCLSFIHLFSLLMQPKQCLFIIMRLMHMVVHMMSYLQLYDVLVKNEIPIITMILAVTMILKLGNNCQVSN